MLDRAWLASRAIRDRLGVAAFGADAGGDTLGVHPAVALALVPFRALWVPPGLLRGPEPGVAGAARRIPLLVAGGAQAALRQGFGLAAPDAEAGFDARGGSVGDTVAIARAIPALLRCPPEISAG